MTERNYRRRQYIVRPGFQLRYVGLILAIIFFTLAITGFTIYYNSWTMLGEKLANVYPQGRLMQIFKTVNARLALNIFFVAILCTAAAIVASHKIAGPVYRMIRFLDTVTSGDYSQRLRLRKGDELTDLADAINRLVEKLDSDKKS